MSRTSGRDSAVLESLTVSGSPWRIHGVRRLREMENHMVWRTSGSTVERIPCTASRA